MSKTVLITGGASGIGLALAKSYHVQGHQVIICDINADNLSAAKAIIPSLVTYECDIGDAAQIQTMAQDINDTYAVDVLINNAGINQSFNLSGNPDSSLAGIEKDIDINLLGPLRLTQALLPSMTERNSGTIVNICSPAGVIPVAAMPGYSLTKAGLYSYSQSLRYQLKDTNIEVVIVMPPRVESGMTKEGYKPMPVDEFIAAIRPKIDEATQEIWVGEAKGIRVLSKLPKSVSFGLVNDRMPIPKKT